MSLVHDAIVGSQEPRFRTVPAGAASSWGTEAIELADSIGLHLDPGQEALLIDGMAEQPNGLWMTQQVVDIEPRQNGKSLLLEVRALAGAYLIKEPLIVWTAHEFKTTKRSFLSLKDKIDNWDHLRKRVKAIRNSGATTEIELLNPTRTIAFLARSGGSGRGFAQVAPLFLDEGYALTEEQMAALIYAMSAARNPQAWIMSSAPLQESPVLRELCKRGRKGSQRMTYYEWSVPGSIKDLSELVRQNKDLDEDEEQTERGRHLRARIFSLAAQANRSIGRPGGVGVSLPGVITELQSTGVEQFLRERLGVWSELEDGGKIAPEQWETLGDALSHRSGDVSLCVDLAIERNWAAIGMYGLREDGLGHVQLIDYREGSSWLPEALIKLRDVLAPLSIAMGRGTYAALKDQLKMNNFLRPEDRPADAVGRFVEGQSIHPPQRGDLHVLNGTEMAAACGGFIEAARQGTIRHVPADQLTRAVRVGKTRVVGDAMAWVRTDPTIDISGLVAVTGAKYSYEARVNEIQDYDPAADIF